MKDERESWPSSIEVKSFVEQRYTGIHLEGEYAEVDGRQYENVRRWQARVRHQGSARFENVLLEYNLAFDADNHGDGDIVCAITFAETLQITDDPTEYGWSRINFANTLIGFGLGDVRAGVYYDSHEKKVQIDGAAWLQLPRYDDGNRALVVSHRLNKIFAEWEKYLGSSTIVLRAAVLTQEWEDVT